MHFRTARVRITQHDSVYSARKAVDRLKIEFAGFPASMVVFFAATDYDPDILAAAMHAAFPGAKTIGATSSGEGIGTQMMNGSLVAMAFSAEFFDFCEMALVLGEGQSLDFDGSFDNVDAAVQHFEERLGKPMRHLDYRKYVGFVLSDAISYFSETLLDRLGDLTDVMFVGGFAGDDYKFERPRVMFEGRAYRRAAVLALWRPRNGFSLLKTQAVDLTHLSFEVTKADEIERIIWEFDGQPAAEVYSRAIGVPVHLMDVLDFDEHPLALMVGNEPFLRAVVKTVDRKGLYMFAHVKEGMRMRLTRAGNILETTEEDIRELKETTGDISAILHINCASRHTALAKRNQCARFGELFEDIPNISFSSYGEIYVGIVAMTSSMIVFK